MVPALRLRKALSVGAKTVIPSVELLSWFRIWESTWVVLRSIMKVVNWPAFSRIPVRLTGPAGPGAGAEEVWARVPVEIRRRNEVRVRRLAAAAAAAAAIVLFCFALW